ncbi:MAG: DUF2125 domain-containing protein [Sandarakinorhabdus sp.]|jgi:hypothetical protein|nr:DUF2125 domain-containing protein [Sandarakinorhabdus sp.]
MIGKRRWPLLLALLPLLLGLGVYWQLWRGWADGFEATLARWFPGERPVATGFPYRLEAELADVALAHDGGVGLGLKVDRLRLNRGPWRPELTVFQGQGIALAARFGALTPRLAAAVGTASLKLDGDRLARLSIALPAARGNFGLGPDVVAERIELHARERIGPKQGNAVLPPRGQLVLNATGLRLGQGAAISLAGDATVRGPRRLDDLGRWQAGGGSIDLTLAGSDATGELFALEATVVPVQDGPRLAGTISTVCPLAVQAALNGTDAPRELRLRAPVRLAIETALPAGGPAALSGLPADLAVRARRAQLPACPRLA